MPNKQFHDENYTNLGGINVKASPYLTGPQEFLNLVNFDFQTPGSLTKRWGSTQYITQSYTGQIQSLVEYSKLDGTSQLVFSVTGGIWSGATQGQFRGLSLGVMGLTYIIPILELGATFGNGVAVNGSTMNVLGSQGTFILNAAVMGQNHYSYITQNNYLFMADGNNFFKYNGVTLTRWGLPKPIPLTYVVFSSLSGTKGMSAGNWSFAISYINERGFEGPVAFSGFAQTPANATFYQHTFEVFSPDGYGITGINIYAANALTKTGPFYRAAVSSQSFFATYQITATVSGNTGYNPVFSQLILPNDYTDFDSRYVFSNDSSTTNLVNTVTDNYLVPKYLETYNNQLFMAGFSATPSNVWFSAIGEPEGVEPENFVEVRTNDGDVVRAMKSFGSAVYLFKTNSFHELSGGDPTNFALREVSDQYGCLSHRATATYNSFMLFLDRKGVIRFNGAGPECISNKVQAVFQSMNVAAAIDNATMVHDKSRNQVLVGIPVNGATFNNVTVVYDYLMDAWTTYEGYNPSVFSVIQGVLPNRAVFYGGYSGLFFNFGSSYFGDNGVGYTCLIKTRYLHDLGQATEKQWRRLYLNVDPVVGSTSVLNINFYKNYGTSLALAATMFQNPFQSRIDFGLSAKSLAFDLSNFSATDSIRLHGFVLSYRFQRYT